MTEFKARPTIYKGIKMRSRLEAGFAGWLDRMHFDWQYEPYAVGDEHGQYLPDFLVHEVFLLSENELACSAYIEVKPNMGAVDFERLGRGATQLRATNPGAVLFVVAPTVNPIAIWSDSGGWCPAVWVNGGARDQDEAPRLAIAAFETPFQKDWWT